MTDYIPNIDYRCIHCHRIFSDKRWLLPMSRICLECRRKRDHDRYSRHSGKTTTEVQE